MQNLYWACSTYINVYLVCKHISYIYDDSNLILLNIYAVSNFILLYNHEDSNVILLYIYADSIHIILDESSIHYTWMKSKSLIWW